MRPNLLPGRDAHPHAVAGRALQAPCSPAASAVRAGVGGQRLAQSGWFRGRQVPDVPGAHDPRPAMLADALAPVPQEPEGLRCRRMRRWPGLFDDRQHRPPRLSTRAPGRRRSSTHRRTAPPRAAPSVRAWISDGDRSRGTVVARPTARSPRLPEHLLHRAGPPGRALGALTHAAGPRCHLDQSSTPRPARRRLPAGRPPPRRPDRVHRTGGPRHGAGDGSPAGCGLRPFPVNRPSYPPWASTAPPKAWANPRHSRPGARASGHSGRTRAGETCSPHGNRPPPAAGMSTSGLAMRLPSGGVHRSMNAIHQASAHLMRSRAVTHAWAAARRVGLGGPRHGARDWRPQPRRYLGTLCLARAA